LEPILAAALALSGILVGFVGALIGIGGSALILPVLILVYGLDPRTAIGTTLAMAIFTAASGTIAYKRQGRIDARLGLLAAAIGVPSAALGAYATRFFSGMALGFILGITLSALSVRWILGRGGRGGQSTLRSLRSPRYYQREIRDAKGHRFSYSIDLLALPILAIPGFLAGFLGIGGGGIFVQIMTYLGVPIHLAIATAMLTMVPMTASGSAVHFLMNNVSIIHAALLGIGILFGTQLGAGLALMLSRSHMERVFGYGIFAIGIWLAIKYAPVFG